MCYRSQFALTALHQPATTVSLRSTATSNSGPATTASVTGVVLPLPEPCTGVSASWCPNCGSCSCEGGHWSFFDCDSNCPLHGVGSLHGEFPACYVCGALFRTEAERDEHEAEC
jgi:hypothetical protein